MRMVEAASATSFTNANTISLSCLLACWLVLFCFALFRYVSFCTHAYHTTGKIWVSLHVDIVIVAPLFRLHMFQCLLQRVRFFMLDEQVYAIVWMDFSSIQSRQKCFSPSFVCFTAFSRLSRSAVAHSVQIFHHFCKLSTYLCVAFSHSCSVLILNRCNCVTSASISVEKFHFLKKGLKSNQTTKKKTRLFRSK